MHLPVWLLYALIALVLWGITGLTQKLSTTYISTRLSFLWFGYAMLAISVVLLLFVPLDGSLSSRSYWMAPLGGALNSLGVITSFAALERGGKASVVIPLIYLYPLVTILLSRILLHERLTQVQVAGIVLAVVAAFLLAREVRRTENEGETSPRGR